jgi:hypothetical protein
MKVKCLNKAFRAVVGEINELLRGQPYAQEALHNLQDAAIEYYKWICKVEEQKKSPVKAKAGRKF